MSTYIELMLFSREPALVEMADRAGMDGFIIDWEDRRQGFEKSHSVDTVDDLKCVASLTKQPVWVRINPPGKWTKKEIEKAIQYGADLIFLPMVRHPDEVIDFLSVIAGRICAGILIETIEAYACAPKLAKLPLECVYVGLFDFLVSRGHINIFEPLTDGTVEYLRNVFREYHFGVGGLTTVHAGSPLPCQELMKHLACLECDFTFLRNSFKRDIFGLNMADELSNIRALWKQLSIAIM